MTDETPKTPARAERTRGPKRAAKPAKASKPAKAAKPAKPASGRKAAPAAPAAAAVEVASATMLRKKALVQRVAEATGVKKKEARTVTEAVLAELGAALSRGEGLILPPLGKARVNRQKETGVGGEVLVVKLRRGGKEAGGGGEEGLAEADD